MRISKATPLRINMPYLFAIAIGYLSDLFEFFRRKPFIINSSMVRYGYCQGYIFSSEKAKKELGYTTSSLDIAILDAITWFKENGFL